MSSIRQHRWLAWGPWLGAYVATMAAVAGGLTYARGRIVDHWAQPAAIKQWREWAAETERPAAAGAPVARRPVKSAEPPALILMRDHFAAILGVTLLISSFLFGFLLLVIRGMWRSANQGDAPSGDEGPRAAD